PAGAINSSAREMGQWIRLMLGEGAIDGRRLVSERGYRELVSPQIATEAGASYGLGWELGREGGSRYVAHDGGAVGHAAHVWLCPAKHRGGAVLANVNDGRQFKEIVRLVDSSLLPPAEEPGRNTPLLATAGILAVGLTVWARRRARRAVPPAAE